MNANLKFYDDIKKVIIPIKYTDFTNSLTEMLEISNDILNCLQIFYKDEEGDKIIIQNVNDYNQFLQQLENKEVSTIEIELGDNNLDLKEEVTKSFVKYPNNNIPEKEIEINNENKTENIKPIMNNNSKNDNFQNNNNENKINNPYLVEPLQVVNQPKIMNAEKIIYQPKKINLHNNNILNNNNIQNNNIMNNNNQNNSMNINNLNNNNMNINNLNNNIMNNNNNQNNNNINVLNQNIQINNQNNHIPSNNSNQLNRNYQNIINFPVNCFTCGKFPIKNILYMCNECTIYFCEQCEKVHGPIHPHPLIKIRTNKQFQKWNILENKEESSSIIKVFGNVKNSVLGGFKSISNYIYGENNNDNKNNMNNQFINNNMNMNQNYFYNNPNQNQINNNYNRNYFSNNNMNQMIQIARNKYNLSNISNEQLEQAIIKANGNIDQAVISFIS